ncbi:hypothetical protein DFJ73DRAFT_832746 [Zopfochytrium polystomum]|nr:hypothetical protein DFJ73DRAFT_832746 [Zopfochytrium polystomum]
MLLDYLCCCVPRTKIARIICLAITFIVLLTLGLVGGFFWPRFPAIHVISINLANLANSYAFSLAPNSTNLNTMTVQLKLTMNISVYNDNLYDLDVEQMYIKAYLLVNTTEIAKHASPASLNIQSIIGPAPLNPDPNYRPSNTTLIGTGTKKTVTFPSKANVTFVMDFLLSYTPDSEVGLIKDPAFAEVMNVCGITSNRRPAEIGYVATSTVSKLSSIGYSPSVQNSVFIKCPVTELQVEQIQNDPEAKTDPFKVWFGFPFYFHFVPSLSPFSFSHGRCLSPPRRFCRKCLATEPWSSRQARDVQKTRHLGLSGLSATPLPVVLGWFWHPLGCLVLMRP